MLPVNNAPWIATMVARVSADIRSYMAANPCTREEAIEYVRARSIAGPDVWVVIERDLPSGRRAALTAEETAFLNHMTMHGIAGYPVKRMGRKWFFTEAFGIKGRQTSYATKKLAVAAVDAYLDVLSAKLAGRWG